MSLFLPVFIIFSPYVLWLFFSASYYVLRYVRFMIYNCFIKENIVWTSSFHISFSSFSPLFSFHRRHLHVSWCSIFFLRAHAFLQFHILEWWRLLFHFFIFYFMFNKCSTLWWLQFKMPFVLSCLGGESSSLFVVLKIFLFSCCSAPEFFFILLFVSFRIVEQQQQPVIK